jgi:hypothetical protein
MSTRPGATAAPAQHPAPPPEAMWSAAPGRAERTVRTIQGLAADRERDAAAVLAEIRRLLDEAGYPTAILGGMDAQLAADLFGEE